MFLKRRLAAFALVIAAAAAGSPVALAGAATSRAPDPVITGPSCAPDYAGPTNLATGCPYWTMSYTVQYPGQPSWRCPAIWGPRRALPDGNSVADACVAARPAN